MSAFFICLFFVFFFSVQRTCWSLYKSNLVLNKLNELLP